MTTDKETIIETKTGKFCIRKYRHDDEKKVLELWKSAFLKEMSPDVWRWKYLENPYDQQIMLCVDEHNHAIVSYGGIPYASNFMGKSVVMTHLMDIMSHPNYRKTGMFIHTADTFFETFAGPEKTTSFYYGFPGKYHFDIGAKYQQYRELIGGVNFLRLNVSEHDVGHDASSKKECHRCEAVDDRFDAIWKKCAKDYPLSIVRNSDFLQWRFIRHPFRTYDIFTHSVYEPSAYAVIWTEEKRAVIVDILTQKDRLVIKQMIAGLIREYKGRGIERIETWLPANHFITHTFIEEGFQTMPEPLGFIPTGRTFDPNLTFDWASENIYYTMADGDLL